MILVLIILGSERNAMASPITINPTDDTFITEHAGLGGSTSIHGSDNNLRLIRGSGPFRTFPLIKFDLNSLVGSTIIGSSAQLGIDLINGGSQSASVREILTDWSEDTASYANFGGVGFTESIHTGANLTTRNVSFQGTSEFILFDIPSVVIQQWIDNPATNFGLAVISNTTSNNQDLTFLSSNGNSAPTLSFEIAQQVPEPNILALFSFVLFPIIAKRGLRRTS